MNSRLNYILCVIIKFPIINSQNIQLHTYALFYHSSVNCCPKFFMTQTFVKLVIEDCDGPNSVKNT